ncbi:alpha/beta hydrolase family protein [Pontimicrobium sp. IMCC45349]|uniref:alpha/beta hydrolase family protein n=1 Tax=Pontimicrobium sp. IMCC45349 TaxID=3391574 RepID=UPI0039A0E494
MKRIFTIILFSIYTTISYSQDISGVWNGIIELGENRQITFVFKLKNTKTGLESVIDIPSNRVEGLKPKATVFTNDSLDIDGSNLGFKFKGKFNSEKKEIEGTFMEGLNALPLILRRAEIEIAKRIVRAQEPKKPYPYYEEEVSFNNEHIKLSGTLTLPKKEGKWPVVVLISGSGPQDRDETFANHKPFLVLADYLTRKGIAVLRYDDRGFGKSTGNFADGTTKDFATDVLSAIEYLKTRKEIDVKNIGLIGHSEGGIIAPMVANWTNDVSFMVIMAGTGIPGSEISLIQSKTMRPFPVPDEQAYEQAVREAISIAASHKDLSVVKKELTIHYNKTIVPILKPLVGTDEKVTKIVKDLVAMRTTKWVRFFYNYNPADEFRKTKIPIFSLNGSKDTQVEAKLNQEGIKNALISGGNKNFKILELENLNHFFQECKTGTMDEYSTIEQTIAPIALNEITSWLLEQIK